MSKTTSGGNELSVQPVFKIPSARFSQDSGKYENIPPFTYVNP